MAAGNLLNEVPRKVLANFLLRSRNDLFRLHSLISNKLIKTDGKESAKPKVQQLKMSSVALIVIMSTKKP